MSDSNIETRSYRLDGCEYWSWRIAPDPFWTGMHPTKIAAIRAAKESR